MASLSDKPRPAKPLRTAEVARQLGMAHRTVVRAVQRGAIPGRKVGYVYLFPPDLLERLGLLPMDGPHPPAKDEGPAS